MTLIMVLVNIYIYTAISVFTNTNLFMKVLGFVYKFHIFGVYKHKI